MINYKKIDVNTITTRELVKINQDYAILKYNNLKYKTRKGELRLWKIQLLSKEVLCIKYQNVISNNKEAIALCDQIYTVDKLRLKALVSKISEDDMKSVNVAMSISFNITPNKISYNMIENMYNKWKSATRCYMKSIA